MACEKPEYRIDQQVARASQVTERGGAAMSALGHSLPNWFGVRFARCPQYPESRH